MMEEGVEQLQSDVGWPPLDSDLFIDAVVLQSWVLTRRHLSILPQHCQSSHLGNLWATGLL